MPTWVNRTTGIAARNGTVSHTITFSAATAGNLLVAVVEAGATHQFSAGWTEKQQPLGGTELSVATKTAAAGETSVTITHNAANYPMIWVVYEFGAGSTFGVSNSAATTQSSDGWTALTAIPSGSTVFAVWDQSVGDVAITAMSTVWTSPGTEDLDAFVPFATPSGAYLSLAYTDNVTSSTFTPAATLSATGTIPSVGERIAFSVLPTGGGGTALSATLALAPTTGDIPAATTATCTASGGTGTTKMYAWDWGDSTTDPAAVANSKTHTYTTVGTYTVTVTVANT